MKCMFDTNVYISYIRDRSHSTELQRRGTVKYLSAIVLMELWAGTKTKKAKKLIDQLQKPYVSAGRIVTLSASKFIAMGQFFADLPNQYDTLAKNAGFVNDVHLAFTTLSMGALLYTEDKTHFQIIKNRMPSLKVEFM
jgi:predicted nucleic acid-binding protein